MNNLLIITRNAWNNNISTGNTMSNFFGDWDGEIANLYCREEPINNDICKLYYKITEYQLIQNIIKKRKVGGFFSTSKTSNTDEILLKREKKKYDFFRSHRWTVFLWLREIIWSIGEWDNDRLDEFLFSFKPKYVLMPLYDCFYMYKILFYIYKKTNAKVIIYSGDDMYTFKQLSFSPLFWIDRIVRRKFIRKAISISDYRFCLSEMQSREYEIIFKKSFHTHMKGIVLEEFIENQINSPITLHYAGNLYPGRWRVLVEIGKAISEINKESKKFVLEVYSNGSPTRRVEEQFKKNNVDYMGSLDANELRNIQKKVDVLVHVESFSVKDRLRTRLSLSTKIIDYLSLGKCIFAVGPSEIASIKYLLDNSLGIVVTDRKNIIEALQLIDSNKDMVMTLGDSSLKYTMRTHDICKIRKDLYDGILHC